MPHTTLFGGFLALCRLIVIDSASTTWSDRSCGYQEVTIATPTRYRAAQTRTP